MSSSKQNLLEYSNVILKKFGTSNTGNLRKAFPSTPQYNDYKDIAAKTLYIDLLNSNNNDASEAISYYGFASFSLNYSENGAPNLNDVEVGAGGLPATPFSPNIASPGPGDASPTSLPEYTGEIKNIDAINNVGSGIGGLASPNETSSNMSNSKLSGYISGKSFQGSDGSP
jgi:hypothetical protein